jgi:hypothetical protein
VAVTTIFIQDNIAKIPVKPFGLILVFTTSNPKGIEMSPPRKNNASATIKPIHWKSKIRFKNIVACIITEKIS